MENTISKNTEISVSKNPLRELYMSLSKAYKIMLRVAYMKKFEIKVRAFYWRVDDRTPLSEQELKWIKKWDKENNL